MNVISVVVVVDLSYVTALYYVVVTCVFAVYDPAVVVDFSFVTALHTVVVVVVADVDAVDDDCPY